MQIANGLLILSPENQQHVRGITPAEAMILHKMHFQYSNGTPLGDFFIQPGEAVTVDQEGRAAEEEWYNQNTGKQVPSRAAVEPVTHKRTQQEEIARLKKKYTGNLTVNGQQVTAFVATFGIGRVVLPETFAEVEGELGTTFHTDSQNAVKASQKARREVLTNKLRADLVQQAIALKLKVHADDDKGAIVSAILEAEDKAEAAKTPELAAN